MKRQPLIVRGTPVVPCFFLIGTVILAYLNLYTDNGSWNISLDTLSFEGLSPYEIYGKIMLMAVPAALFLTVLFFGEKSLRWVILGLAVPVAWELSNFVYYFESPDALLSNLLQYILPFVAIVVFIFTIEGILPTKWILVGVAFVMALLPTVLTLFGVSEFIYDISAFDYSTYQTVNHRIVDWSTVLYWGTYYGSVGALGIIMRKDTPASEPVPVQEEAPAAEA